jgi:hypothetical protein
MSANSAADPKPAQPKTALAKPVRRVLSAIRSLRPAALIAVVVALALGGTGIAGAATGRPFLLGQANSEKATATLTNTKGTPLSLSAPVNKAPLKVNRKALVTNLNSQFVGGLSSTQLKTTGGDGFTADLFTITTNPQVIIKTGPLSAGTYYVTATARLFVAAADSNGFCVISKGSNSNQPLAIGEFSGGGEFGSATETVAVNVKANDTLDMVCAAGGDSGHSTADNAGITAIRVMSSSGTPPA